MNKRCRLFVACVVLLVVFVVVSFLIILLGRCATAANAYVSSHDGNWNMEDVFESEEFQDWDEASYWWWGVLWCVIFWAAVLVVLVGVWLCMWASRVWCNWYCCDSMADAWDYWGGEEGRRRRRELAFGDDAYIFDERCCDLGDDDEKWGGDHGQYRNLIPMTSVGEKPPRTRAPPPSSSPAPSPLDSIPDI